MKERFTFVYTVLISCFDKSEGRGDYLLQRIRMILQLITTGRQKCMFKNEILTSFISFLNIHSKRGDDRDTARHPLVSVIWHFLGNRQTTFASPLDGAIPSFLFVFDV